MHRLLAISDDIFATVNRYRQAIIWIPWAFVLGAIQALASMTPVMLERGDPSSRDLHRVFWGLTLVYGGGWFIPALLISDFFLMWRGLSWGDLKRYALLTAITALVIGLALSGMMLMVGFPLTAVSILVLGFVLRKRPQVSSKI